jgi:hypothetical protein
MVACVYAWTSIYKTAEEMLWNPLVLCGIPSYAITTGVVWFNMISNYYASFRFFIFNNPMAYLMVWVLIFWANEREGKKKSLTIINVWIFFVDFMMLVTTQYK